MDSKLNVTYLGESTPAPAPEQESSISVPNTGTLTDTGLNHDGMDPGLFISGTGLFIVAILSIVITATFIRHRKQTHLTYDSKRKLSGFKITSVFSLLVLLSLAVALPLTEMRVGQSESASAVNPDEINVLSISIDNNIGIDLRHANHETYGVAKTTLTINAPNPNGYFVGVYADTSDLKSETAGNESKINGLTAASSVNYKLGPNTWGLSTVEPTSEDDKIWAAVPSKDTGAVLGIERGKDTTDPRRIDLYYGVKIDESLPYGTYSTTLNYVTVAKISSLPQPCQPPAPEPGPGQEAQLILRDDYTDCILTTTFEDATYFSNPEI